MGFVPAFEGQKCSLGYQVVEWLEEYACHGPGDVEGERPRKKIPAKVMWYAPIIPRLKSFTPKDLGCDRLHYDHFLLCFTPRRESL